MKSAGCSRRRKLFFWSMTMVDARGPSMPIFTALFITPKIKTSHIEGFLQFQYTKKLYNTEKRCRVQLKHKNLA